MFRGKLKKKKKDNILIYSVKDVTQNIDYLILLHTKKTSVYVEQFSTWECCEYRRKKREAKCMIKYTFHLLLCDIEGIKITEGITHNKRHYYFSRIFLFTIGTRKVMDCLLICLQFLLFSVPHSISVILLLHGFDNNKKSHKNHKFK